MELHSFVTHVKGIATQLTNLGQFAEVDGRTADARAMFSQSVAESEKVGDPALTASALNNLASLESDAGSLDQALALWNRTLPLFRESGATKNVSLTLYNLGELHQKQGRLDDASKAFQEAFNVASTDENLVEDRAYALMGLGLVAEAQDNTVRAREMFRKAETLFLQEGDKDSADKVAQRLRGLK